MRINGLKRIVLDLYNKSKGGFMEIPCCLNNWKFTSKKLFECQLTF